MGSDIGLEEFFTDWFCQTFTVSQLKAYAA